MPRFLRALLVAVGASVVTFLLGAILWDRGVADLATLLVFVPGVAVIAAVVLAAAGRLTRGRLVPMLGAAAAASLVGGLGIGWMTAGITTNYSLWDAAQFGTLMLAGGLVPGAAVFSRVYLTPPRPGTAPG